MDAGRRVEGVDDVMEMQWFGAYYQDPENFFAQFAIDQTNFLDVYDEVEFIEGTREDFLASRKNCIIGFLVADRFTIADISVAGFFINLRLVEIEIDASRAPNLRRYCENHWQRPSLAKFISEETEFLGKMRAAAQSS